MANSYYAVYEHIVFSTKNRVNWFSPEFRPELFAYFAGAIKNQNCHSLIVGGHDNHVHLLLRKHGDLRTRDLVKELKRNSSIWMKEKGVGFRKFYWQTGFGAFSVSYWDLEKIANYIRNQAEHHGRMSWGVEYKKLLIKHGVEFDERYYLD